MIARIGTQNLRQTMFAVGWRHGQSVDVLDIWMESGHVSVILLGIPAIIVMAGIPGMRLLATLASEPGKRILPSRSVFQSPSETGRLRQLC